MNKFLSLLTVTVLMLVSLTAEAGFGGSRGGGSFGGSRSSSFGGSRSYSAPSRSYSAPSRSSGSSFGGSRSTTNAPIVRNNSGSSSSSSGSSSTTHVYNNYGGGYGGYGGGYYGGNGFIHGYMWGQFFNRPQVIYVGGNQYVQGPNGQPMLDGNGQPVVYESPSAFGTAFAIIIWLCLIGLAIWGVMYLVNRNN